MQQNIDKIAYTSIINTKNQANEFSIKKDTYGTVFFHYHMCRIGSVSADIFGKSFQYDLYNHTLENHYNQVIQYQCTQYHLYNMYL